MKTKKKIAGAALLGALLMAPIALMSASAVADVCTQPICYTGKIGKQLGIEVHDVDPDIADLLVRARVASYDYENVGGNFLGYEVCRQYVKRK